MTIPRVNDKLAQVKSPGTELVDVKATESQGARRPWQTVKEGAITIGGYLRVGIGEGVGLFGDVVKARLGKHAAPLHERIKKYERTIAGPSDTENKQPLTPTSSTQAPMEYELTAVAFTERIAVALDLTHLVQEVMAPGGWSHTVSLPIDRARQLLSSLAPFLGEGSGWEKTVSSCHGFITNIERAASELRRLDHRRDDAPDAQESQERRAQIKAQLTEAQIAMGELRAAISKLVVAARAYRPEADEGA